MCFSSQRLTRRHGLGPLQEGGGPYSTPCIPCTTIHISHESLGKGSQGNPRRLIRDYKAIRGYRVVLGLMYWDGLAPLA